jgi:hypothetical protein
VARHATQDEKIGQQIDHIDGLELAGDPDRQAFVGELVDLCVPKTLSALIR